MKDSQDKATDTGRPALREATVVLDDWAWALDVAALSQKLRLKEGSRQLDELRLLVDQAQSIGRPKAQYRITFIQARGEDWVEMDGVRLSSRVLSVNLAPLHRVFPYVATGGAELGSWVSAQTDLLRQYWADAIAEAALRLATAHLRAHLQQVHGLGRLSAMAPGSLADWPLEEQGPLFTLLGDTEATIGVRLTERFLMLPTKSVSGILFPTESSFESCQLCPRERCPGRRAPHDPTLFAARYRRPEMEPTTG